MQNIGLSNKENLMNSLPEKVREFNNLLLCSSWAEIDFNSPEFKNGICLDNSLLSASQKELLREWICIAPEWKRVIGCKQHKTHSYCLDIHILLVLKKIKDQEKFKELDNYSKLILLWAALLHDIEKKENVVDPDHPSKGAEIANVILRRLEFDDYFIKSVYTLVKYHPLIGFIAIDRLNLNVSEISGKIGDEKMLDLFIIFSIADIRAVKSNDAFYNDNIDKSIKHIYLEIKNYYRKITD